MLNKDNVRELAYIVKIDDITAIPGYDRVELAHVGGWTIVVGKGEFKVGDPAIYFEIDSQLPEVEPFTNMEFLAKKHYKIKTQKMCKSLSQGLLMSAANFGWIIGSPILINPCGYPNCRDNNCENCDLNKVENAPCIYDNNGNIHIVDDESRFLTEQLGVTYAVPEDNVRKSGSADKYKKMAQRHSKLFSKQPFRWLMRRNWGKKVLFVFFGSAKDKKTGWPSWVSKTDEERVQNMPWILNDKNPWIATEKIDGTSTTFTMRKYKKFFSTKYDFFVCSRNVVFDKPDKKCFYETNVYTEMAEKYNMEYVLRQLLDNVFTDAEWVTIQGETYGAGIQKRDYSMDGHDFRVFNLVVSNKGRLGSKEAADIVRSYELEWVPILDDYFILPDTVDELLTTATGKSVIDGKPREGIVFRYPDGSKSFKAVSNEFLLEFHQ